MLKAATPVQVVVGSFIAEGKKLKPAAAPLPQMPGFGGASAPCPPSKGSSSESDGDGPGSPSMNQSTGGGNCNDAGQHYRTIPTYSWPQLRHDSDVRMMPN
ncbi:AT-hook motif nuclear-localized protein 10-like [Iris pallida]|nr:AT-hook motif nuclear-localized protein 10-like [Iris pallida]